ncbi:hypothetical protein CAP35_14090 [Chitinophagaceae bacterium IBVUCB1]|nr:hypothetical protein CAP35_14090 [Chitinophagaceae bacterium IBVUCB1]
MYLVIPIRQILAMLSLLLCFVHISVAQSGNVLYVEVASAQKRGTSFTEYVLFQYGGIATMVDGGSLLYPQSLSIAKLYNEAPQAITVRLPASNGGYTLSMLRSNPATADIVTNTISEIGRTPATYDAGIHYHGCIAGQAHTIAMLSVFADGRVMILFADKSGNYVAGKLHDNSNNYVLYKDDALKGLQPFTCKAQDPVPRTTIAEKTTAVSNCKTVTIYMEGDYGLYVFNNRNLTATQSYITGLFNQMQGIYKNDSMFIVLSSMDIWTVPDKYCDTNADFASTDFQKAWAAKGHAYKGDFAILVACDSANNGGIAGLLAICDKPNAYSYVDVDGVYKTIPVYSKDVMVICHELGHQFGSMHTHWCGWHTGLGGTCGAIDNCAAKDKSPGCTACGSVLDDGAPLTAWSGTIMSYCHLRGRGINLANGFGTLPAKEMRGNINNPMLNTCLSHSIKATLQVEPICRGEGKINVILDTSYLNTGLIPPSSLNYYWTTGATTQNLHGIATPGMYGVNITDGVYKCQIQYLAPITLINTDSCRFRVGIHTTQSAQSIATISPNPSKGISVLTLNNDNEVSIVIADVLGKICFRANGVRQSQYQINTSNYPSGVYTVAIFAKTGKQYIKLSVY